MLSYAQAIILGIIQGVTELFPISSLGHSVIVPALLHWSLNEHAPYFLTFLVATHFATALVLLGFFFKDWVRIVFGFFRTIKNRGINPNDTYERLSWIIVIATIPTALIGFLFQKPLQELFATPIIVALFLTLNGFLLYCIEEFKKHRQRVHNSMATGDVAIARLPWISAFGTGLAQSIALLPGFSRTGSSLGGGLLAGLDHESAARFSFLMATPIIFAAAALKLPILFQVNEYPVNQILAGALAAGIAGFLSIVFLMRFFKINTMRPFAFYCMAAGIISLILLTR